MRQFIGILGYSVFLLITVALGTEIGLRWYFDDPEYRGGGYVSISPNPFVNEDGFWRYRPNARIRQVAVYGFPTPRYFPPQSLRIEYDCEFPTNRFGLQGNNADFVESRPTVLILGDSFTEGRGGCPWMQEVVRRFPEFNLLNGGIQIAGIESFYRLYEFLLDQDIDIDKVLVIAIADDFKRTPKPWPQGVLDCLSFRADCPGNWMWRPLRVEQTHEDLIAQARERQKQRFAGVPNDEILEEWFSRNVYLYSFLTQNLKFYFGDATYREGQPDIGPTVNNVAALKRLQAQAPGLEIILVPQRDEVAMRRPNLDGLEVRELLDELQIDYSFCALVHGDYLPYDPHPNAGGYAKLADCLRQKLEAYRSSGGQQTRADIAD